MALADLARTVAAGGYRQTPLEPGGAWRPADMPDRVSMRPVGRTGRPVTYDRALTHRAVYSSVDLLARLTVWQMPIACYRNGVLIPTPRIIANPDPAPQLTGEHWRTGALESALLRGFAAGLVTSVDRLGWPQTIQLVHPDQVTYTRRPGQGVRWYVAGQRVELFQHGGPLWIAPSMRVPPGGQVGLSVIAHAAEVIDVGLEARTFTGDFFRAGGMPVAHAKITSRGDLNETQIEVLRGRILEATQGRRPLVTGTNVELSKVDISAEDAQFLQTAQANLGDVAGYFGVPPEAIGGTSGGSLTYSNVEGQNLQLLTNTVGAWMTWWQITLGALTPAGTTVVLDPKKLLQTSIRALWETIATGVGRGTPGFVTPNEGRREIGLPPLDDPAADELFRPVGLVPLPTNPTDPGAQQQ